MAITVASLTSGFDVDANTTAVTASISPTANRLILAAVVSNNFFSFDTCTASGNGLTWVQIANFDIDSAGSHAQLTLFRAMGASPSSGAVTFTLGAAKDAISWAIVEFDGVDTGGTNGSAAVVQAVTATGNSTALLSTLSSFGHADNATFGAFGSYHGAGATITPGTGFTELYDQVDTTTEYTHVQVEWKSGNDTTVDATLSSSAVWGAIGVEIKAASGSPDVTVNLSGVSSASAVGNLTADTGGPIGVALTSGSDNTLGASALTASISPTANSLVLLAVSSVNWFDAATWTASGCNLTWVQIANIDFNPLDSHSQLVVFRALGSSPTTGQITISNSTNKDEITWSVVEFNNVDTSGTNGSGAVVQVVSATGNSTAPAVTLATFASSSNATYAAVSAYDFGGTITPETNWVELHDVTGTATYTHTETEWKSNDNTASATLGVANPWCIVAIEIQALTSSDTYNLTGTSSSGQVGTVGLQLDQTLPLTGTSVTGAVGTVSREDHGVQSNASVGTLGIDVQNDILTLLSEQITGVVGTLTVTNDTTVALSGVVGNTQVHNVIFVDSVGIAGVELTGSVGTVTTGTQLIADLSGVESTTAFGNLTSNRSIIGLPGNSSNTSVGSISPMGDLNVVMSGVSLSSQVGNVVLNVSKTISGNRVFVLVGSVTSHSSSISLSGIAGTGGVGTLTPDINQDQTISLTGVAAVGSVGIIQTSGGVFIHFGSGQSKEKFKKRPQKEDLALKWTIAVIGSEEKYYGAMIRKHYPSIKEDELSHTINNIVTSMHTFLNANPNIPSFDLVLKREKEIVKHWSLIALQTYNASVKLPAPPLHMTGLLDR